MSKHKKVYQPNKQIKHASLTAKQHSGDTAMRIHTTGIHPAMRCGHATILFPATRDTC